MARQYATPYALHPERSETCPGWTTGKQKIAVLIAAPRAGILARLMVKQGTDDHGIREFESGRRGGQDAGRYPPNEVAGIGHHGPAHHL